MVHVYGTMWRIKNQPSNPISCSDNALRLLVLVTDKLYWGLQVISSFSSWGLCFEGLFWERYISKGQIAFEGHWRLQSWTLPWTCSTITGEYQCNKSLDSLHRKTPSNNKGVIEWAMLGAAHMQSLVKEALRRWENPHARHLPFGTWEELCIKGICLIYKTWALVRVPTPRQCPKGLIFNVCPLFLSIS